MTALVMIGLVAIGGAILRQQNTPPNLSEVSLSFIGQTKWIDFNTGMPDGRKGVRFSIGNDSDSSLCIGAMAANNSNIFQFNSVGFGLTPHSKHEFTILAPTSSTPWRVIVRCREATHIDPDDPPWEKIHHALAQVFGDNRYFYDKRGGTDSTLVSRDF